MRVPTACAQCRRAKRRCIRHKAREDCASCQERQLVCEGKLQVQVVGQRPLAPRSSATERPSSKASQHSERQVVDPRPVLSQGTIIELVDHYLDKFSGRPHSIFHPATLRSLVRSGILNETLLYAICATGCRFSANPDTRCLCSGLTAESKRLLQADISNICLENIQACILVATLSVGHGDSPSAALFFRIATAMAEIMSLDSPVPGASAIDCETRRRVWWSLYVTDMWCMSGQRLHNQLENVETKMNLPINDEAFMSLHTEQVAIVDPLEQGIWAQMMTLVSLFGPIHNINRLVADGEPHTIELDQKVEQLASNLEDWQQKLPVNAQMNQGNLHRQQRKGLGGLLISIHLAYHHYSTLLYFRYLEVQRPTSSTDHTYITRCKSHASSFSSLLSLSRQLKGCEVVYPTVGHMATVSSSVLVHGLLFGDLNELETVRKELNTNFEALIELEQYWPAVSTMIESLVVFQDMCLLSTEPGTHRLDGWMLRFLTDHSLDITARKRQVNQSILNADLEKLSSKAKEFAEQGRYLSFRTQ